MSWAVGKMTARCFLTLGVFPLGPAPQVFPRSSLAGEELGLHRGCWPRRPRSLLGHTGGFPCPPLWHLPPWSSAHSPCSPSQHRVSGGLALTSGNVPEETPGTLQRQQRQVWRQLRSQRWDCADMHRACPARPGVCIPEPWLLSELGRRWSPY